MDDRFPKQPLSMIAKIERGKFSTRPRNDPQYYGGTTPFIQTGDITRAGRTIVSWSQTLNEKGLGVSRLFPKGTILMTIAANIGDVAISSFETACPDSVVAFSPENGIDHEWLFQTLKFSKPGFAALATQNAQANLSLEKIAPFKVHVPPLTEQRKIAEILRTWDEAIEKLETLRALKAKKLEHLSWRLIHGDHHQKVRLQDLLTRGVSIEKGTVLTRETSLSGPYAVIGGGQSASYSHCRYTHKPPCITVSASGAYAGFVWRHREPIWASDCNVLTTNSLSLDYLFFALKTQQKKLYSLQSGGAQPHVYSKDILSLKIPLPSGEMQEKIAEFLNAATEEVVLLNQQVIALTRQKRGLMQKLLTGEWRVTP